MKKSSDDLYISGQYLKNTGNWNEADSEWKAGIIYQLYRKNNIAPQSVVEIGCGAGGILNHLSTLDKSINSLCGYDISPQAISLANEKINEKLSFYNQDFLTANLPVVDLLLVIDVIEHVDDYYNFLRKIFLKGKQFIFHIPLDLSCRTILKPKILWQQRESVGHIHYFSEEMILWIFKDIGYRIIDWHFTKPTIDLEKNHSLKPLLKKSLRNFSFKMNESVSAKLFGGYSMMILAEPE